MRVIFMGTPDFAVPSLEMLVNEGYDVVLVVTQPDKPKGRGNKLAAPAVKEAALKHGLNILQPVKVRTDEFYMELKSLEPDLIITIAYGRILTQKVLDIPKFGCINVHASLLPKYRGAAPIQWSIINGETVTGITTMYMDVGIDTGDMLLKKQVAIDSNMTYGELHDILMPLGAQALKETLEALKSGTLKAICQDHDNFTCAPPINKSHGMIDWNKSANDIHNLVRGMAPLPGAFTFFNDEKIKIWMTDVIKDCKEHSVPGTILNFCKDGVLVAAGNNAILIKEIQCESGKRMPAECYIFGHTIKKGDVLGKRC